MVLDPRTGDIWLHGGVSEGIPLSSSARSATGTWRLSPDGSWQRVAENACCALGSLAFDERRGVLVQAGGYFHPTEALGGPDTRREVWELHEGSWRLSPVLTPVLYTEYSTLVFSPALSGMLFHSCQGACSVSDLWRYGGLP